LILLLAEDAVFRDLIRLFIYAIISFSYFIASLFAFIIIDILDITLLISLY